MLMLLDSVYRCHGVVWRTMIIFDGTVYLESIREFILNVFWMLKKMFWEKLVDLRSNVSKLSC